MSLISQLSSLQGSGKPDPIKSNASSSHWATSNIWEFLGGLRLHSTGNPDPNSLLGKHIFSSMKCTGPAKGCSFKLILPVMVGTYPLCSHQCGLDPILALAGLSAHFFAKRSQIRDPYMQQLMEKRALMVLLFTLLIGRSFLSLFLFVSGKGISKF